MLIMFLRELVKKYVQLCEWSDLSTERLAEGSENTLQMESVILSRFSTWKTSWEMATRMVNCQLMNEEFWNIKLKKKVVKSVFF